MAELVDDFVVDERQQAVALVDQGHPTSRTVTAKKIVIAAGAETTRAPNIPFDGVRIFTSDDILQLDRLPRTLAVVGAGVIGCEYASIFAALGVKSSPNFARVEPAASFVEEARRSGAHTVELNLEPSHSASFFAERIYGPASRTVPEYVAQLING